MNEFEKTLRAAAPRDLPVEEFRRTLRRDLLGELGARGARRTRQAWIGLSATAATLAVVCLLFVLRPGLPQSLHSTLFHGDPATDAGDGTELRQILSVSGASASADQEWIEDWYADRAMPARVEALDDERIFALRRFVLTSGERIVVLTEIVGEGRGEPTATMPAARSF